MIISFDNDTVSLDLNGITSSAPITLFAEELFTKSGFYHKYHHPMPDFLPANMRWVSDNGKALLVERPPCYVNISYHNGNAGNGRSPESFTIPLPWQSYFIDIDSPYLYVYFHNQQITSLTDDLFSAPLHNIHTGGQACIGGDQMSDISEMVGSESTKSSIINTVINDFWMHVFNDDIKVAYHNLPFELQEDEDIQNSAIRSSNLNPSETRVDLENLRRDFPVGAPNGYYYINGKDYYKALEKYTIEDVSTWTWYSLNFQNIEKLQKTWQGTDNFSMRNSVEVYMRNAFSAANASSLARQNQHRNRPTFTGGRARRTRRNYVPTIWNTILEETYYLNEIFSNARQNSECWNVSLHNHIRNARDEIRVVRAEAYYAERNRETAGENNA